MQIEQLSAEPRPRLSWEAADLGLALMRRHYGPVMAAWCAILLPLTAAGFLLVWWAGLHPLWLMPVFWWLKPALDRPVLWYLSRALFGAAPRWHEVFKAWPRMLMQCAGELTFRRISARRSLLQPVRMLEGIRGDKLRQRLEVLRQHGGGDAMWLGVAAGAAAGFVALGLLVLALVLVPTMYQPDWDLVFIELEENFRLPFSRAEYGWLVVLYLVVVSLVEPFYVAAGFGMYLNSRAWLEGWDVELGFRRLSRRLRPEDSEGGSAGAVPPARPPAASRGRGVAGPAVVLLAAGLGFGLGLGLGVPRAVAEDDPAATAADVQWGSDDGFQNPAVDDETARELLAGVLEHPDFEVHTRRVPTGRETRTGTNAGPGLVAFGRALFWVALAAVVLWLAWWLWLHRHQLRPQLPAATASGQRPRLRRLAGIELDREALPGDVGAAAWELWQGGRQREALALLYRGSLAWLSEFGQLPLRESDTERQCLEHSRQLEDPVRREAFAELSHGWVALAYGGVPPAGDDVRRWCERWPFDLAGGGAAEPGSVPVGASSTTGGSAAVALLLCAGLALPGGLTGCQRAYEEIEVGYRGEARKEPLLAAQRLLEAMDWHVIRQGGLLPVAEYWDDLMVVPGSLIADSSSADALEEWIGWGGHALVFLEGAEIYTSDWGMTLLRSAPDGPGDMAREFLERFGIVVGNERLPRRRGTFELPGGSRTVDLGSGPALAVARAPDAALDEFVLGEAGRSPMVSLRHGDGRITVVNDATPFRNRQLDQHDHLLVWMDVMWLSPTAYVVFVSGGRELSFLGMLWREGWRGLVPLLLLVLLWWWRRLPRFGPRRGFNESTSVGFDRHLLASGHFLHRHGRFDALLDGLRGAVRQAWLRHGHGVAAVSAGAAGTAGGSGAEPALDEAMFGRLAARSGLAPERVRAAMTPEPDPRLAEAHFTRCVADLQLMLRTLTPDLTDDRKVDPDTITATVPASS